MKTKNVDKALARVETLTVSEANTLLQRGIPLNEFDAYRTTIYAGNESFLDHLRILESFNVLTVKEEKLTLVR